MDDALLHFRPAHALGAGIARAFKDEQAEILSLLPHAEVLHTGATSVPAALTRGDLDIHVRVSSAEFSGARDALGGIYASYRTETWTGEFATFIALDASIATGIALTAIGGEHDHRFIIGWDRLACDRRLLEEYNALKLKYDDTADADSYEAAKSTFFSALVAGDPDSPAARGRKRAGR